MSEEVEVRESEELALPHSGELVRLEDAGAVAHALEEVRILESNLIQTKRSLSEALIRYWRHRGGAKSFTVDRGRRVEVKGGPEFVYDAEAIERELREAGMPEDRIREVVKEEVSYVVKAVEAKRAAAANEEYAAIIERNRVEVQKPYNVSIRRR